MKPHIFCGQKRKLAGSSNALCGALRQSFEKERKSNDGNGKELCARKLDL